MTFSAFQKYLDDLLQISAWNGKDRSLNGLQVSTTKTDISRVAFAVDASLLSFERAIAEHADVLVVHHGLFWGNVLPVVKDHYKRLKTLIDAPLALYTAHLPLDAHAEVGNNAGMAKALGLENVEPFGNYHGVKIGVKGTLPKPTSIVKVCEVLFHGRENVLQILPFGTQNIQSIGIVSGGATRELTEAIDQGLDLYITGDADHTVYHTALEAKINMISGGHYATETWGVKLLSERVARDTGLTTVYLDLPTGL